MFYYITHDFTGHIDEVILEAQMVHRETDYYMKDDKYINGMPEYTVKLQEHIQVF